MSDENNNNIKSNPENDEKRTEKDDFWTLDEMLPPKSARGAFARDTETVLVQAGISSEGKKEAIPKRGNTNITVSKENYSANPINSYEPSNSLIKRVTVWLWPSRYSFYERFRDDAQKNFVKTHGESPFVPFYSYVPQYAQLNYKQYCFYLWWRENVRNKTYIDTDYSYILLYIYEIINLPEFIEPNQGLELLCDLWLSYRKRYSKLDQSLCEWLCDYCLIYNLEPPLKRLETILDVIMKHAAFKEFYIFHGDENSKPYASFLMNFSSNYNYSNSKYLTEENRQIFNRHINGAFAYALDRLSVNNPHFKTNGKSFVTAKLTRDAFAGSLCAYNIKRRIDIEYISYTRSSEIRRVVTDLIKLAENNVRYLLDIKARLATPYLNDEMKQAVNEYFLPLRKKRKAKREIPEYEKQYEAKSSEFSIDDALDLEKKSWDIVTTLEGALDDNIQDTSNPSKNNDESSTKIETAICDIENIDPVKNIEKSCDENQANIISKSLRCLLRGDKTGFNSIAQENNMLPDALAEIINEYMYDILGDIAIETVADGYSIIEEYRTEIEEMEGFNDG